MEVAVIICKVCHMQTSQVQCLELRHTVREGACVHDSRETAVKGQNMRAGVQVIMGRSATPAGQMGTGQRRIMANYSVWGGRWIKPAFTFVDLTENRSFLRWDVLGSLWSFTSRVYREIKNSSKSERASLKVPSVFAAFPRLPLKSLMCRAPYVTQLRDGSRELGSLSGTDLLLPDTFQNRKTSQIAWQNRSGFA